MLKHRNIVVLFIILLGILVWIDSLYDLHRSLYFLLLLVFLAIEFYGSYFIHSGFHLKALCKIKTREKLIALSFDDGPGSQTEKVLDVLDEFDAKAAFFCIGKHIKGKEELLRKIDMKGHLVGNHSYSHDYWFDLKNTAFLVQDLEHCNAEISQVIHKTPVFFRPPYGVTTPGLARAAKKLKFEVIGWNIRSLDTSLKDKEKLLARIKKRLKPGSILLMHDTVSGIEIVLRQLLSYLKEQNYKIVPLDQLIQKQAYA